MTATLNDQLYYPEGTPDDFQAELEREQKRTMTATHLVKIAIPKVGGKMVVSGRITHTLPDGRVEIKTQQNGYHIVKADEIIQS